LRTFTVALAGNPNVGKSSIFNALTHLHQHTGNWPGKTVSNATGQFFWRNADFTLVDLPGTYSLRSGSVEEEIARDYIKSGEADFVVCVADATCLQRNLNLILQIQELTPRLIVCVNLLDEAKKKRIRVDLLRLSQLLRVPVIGTSARSGRGLTELKDTLYQQAFLLHNQEAAKTIPVVDSQAESTNRTTNANRETNSSRADSEAPEEATAAGETPSAPDRGPDTSNRQQPAPQETTCASPEEIARRSQFIYQCCVRLESEDPHRRDRRLDRLFTSRRTGYPIMILLLCVIFWLTISGANIPSQWLAQSFTALEPHLRRILQILSVPAAVESLLVDGLYKTLTWVVSVMLPPMAIFFPMFTLLEDSGYLPRIAFNLDHCFRRCGAHGKQALTTCMAFGCNACAVTGCRIIESPRERIIAILTNSLIPCNGKFAGLIAILTMFFAGSTHRALLPALLLTLLILLCFGLTLFLSRLLSRTLLKGLPSSFALELPPYRRPQFGKVILRSVLDRTLFVLGRAVCVAAPAGVLIWLLANAGLLPALTAALDPLGRLMGLDGVILAAFLLGFPANEIVIPIMLMTYLSTGVLTDYASLTELHQLLLAHGWSSVTALCFLLFSVAHHPCGTTCLTIYKETKSWKWTAAAILIPTVTGMTLCIAVNSIFQLVSSIL